MKILIFTEGTIIMHKSAVGCSREQIVQQIKDQEPSISDFEQYVPIGNAVKKITQWKKQGADIFYLTSRRKPEEISDIKLVLNRFNFPIGQLLARQTDEEYKDVAERIMPDILIEDDCESIGGLADMTITHLNPFLKAKTISISVKEFGGIDHLSDDITELSRTSSIKKHQPKQKQ